MVMSVSVVVSEAGAGAGGLVLVGFRAGGHMPVPVAVPVSMSVPELMFVTVFVSVLNR